MRRFQLTNVLQRAVNSDCFRAPRSIKESSSVDSASKKRRSNSLEKSTTHQLNTVRVPKTAMRRCLHANVLHRSAIFDSRRAPRSIEASSSIDLASKKRHSISIKKSKARQQNIARSPKTAMRRFQLTNVLQRAVNLTVFEHLD